MDHQIQRLFRRADRTHAVVNAARSKAHLTDFKTASLAPQDVFLGDAHVCKPDLHMAMGCIVMAKHAHRANDFHTGRIHRHQNLALLAEFFRVG